ncbi:MAG: hypothetical protein QM811_03260 [Pirellulales bacterium]
MNKIVREHYPVSKLPEDLQQEFEGAKTVRIIAELAESTTDERDFWSIPIIELKPRTPDQVIADFNHMRSLGLPSVTPEEAVTRIRELRDEWEINVSIRANLSRFEYYYRHGGSG